MPQAVYKDTPNNVFAYSFSLYPQEIQPSGSANLDIIQDVRLKLTLNVTDKYVTVHTFARTNNILRIMSGMGSTVY